MFSLCQHQNDAMADKLTICVFHRDKSSITCECQESTSGCGNQTLVAGRFGVAQVSRQEMHFHVSEEETRRKCIPILT